MKMAQIKLAITPIVNPRDNHPAFTFAKQYMVSSEACLGGG
jgi:hypothetical protein